MIHLSESEIDFLLVVVDPPSALRQRLMAARAKDGVVSEDDAATLQCLCGARFQTHGLGPDYEPTLEGRKLEALIDKLAGEQR